MLIEKLNKIRSENDSEAGFTLIELMIVVVIIGILAAVAIPVFLNQQKDAIASSIKSDVKNTVTNVVTALAKNPDATYIGGTAVGETGTYTKADPGPIQIGNTTVTTTAVISDLNTVIRVTGDWEEFTIEGSNALSLGTGTYVFSSSTGKYEATGMFVL